MLMRLLILLTSLLAVSGARAQLLVTDLVGPASLAGGARLAILASLPPGQVLTLGPQARAVLAHLASGREFQLAGPGEYRTGADSVIGPGGAAISASPLPGGQLPAVSKTSRIAMAATRMRSLASCEPEADPISAGLEPTDTLIGADERTLRWTPVANADTYWVSIGPPGSGSLGVQVTPARSWQLPASITLTPGQTYEWRVQAYRGTLLLGTRVGSFGVLTADAVARLAQLAPAADAPLAHRVLQAAQWQEVGARQRACALWRDIRAQRPDDPGLEALLR